MTLVSKRIIIANANFEDIKITNPLYVLNKVAMHGTISGPTTIGLATVSVTVTPDTDYVLPTQIKVLNAEYTYDKDTGVVVLSNPIGDVLVYAECANSLVPPEYTQILGIKSNNNQAYISLDDVKYNANNKYEAWMHADYLSGDASSFGMGWNYGGLVSVTFTGSAISSCIGDGSQNVCLLTEIGKANGDYNLEYKSIISKNTSGTTETFAYNANNLAQYKSVTRQHASLGSHGNIGYGVGYFVDSDSSTSEPKGNRTMIIYGFTMKINDTMYSRLIPCMRNSDGKVGMWDASKNMFRVSPNGQDFLPYFGD